MSDETHWYFAYGSNMQADTLRIRRRIEPAGTRAGVLRGYGLSFDIPIGSGRRGVANLCAAADASVWGVLYLLTPHQHAHLDRTEGVPNGLYRRVSVQVVADSEILPAETLISEVRDPLRRPSWRYLSLLLDGARENGLPHEWIRALEDWNLAWDERDGAYNPPGLARE